MRSGNVSVIIPSFNRAYCVFQAIDSVIAQTYSNWTVIVVDDGSTDGTRDLIASRYGKEARVRYLYQENGGVCAARNFGLRHADGEFIGFLDSDDLWQPWKLELQVACLTHCPAVGMIWTDMSAVNQDGEVIYENFLKRMYTAYERIDRENLFTRRFPIFEVAPRLVNSLPRACLYTGDIFSQMVRGNLVHTSTVLLRRDRLEQVGGFNEDLKPSGEDYDFHLRTCRAGPVAFVNVSSVRYRIGTSDQLTAPSYNVDIARNFLRTIEPVIQADRSRISLSDNAIRSVRAYAHAWLGEQLVLSGDPREARSHLVESLRQSPGAWAAQMLVLSFLPRKGVNWLRKLRRTLFPRHANPTRSRRAASRPKVLFLIDTLMGMGGAEGALLKMTQQLPKLGWDCAIATFRPSTDPAFLKLFSCPVYDLTLRRVFSIQAVWVAFKLRALVAREQFDIVHSFYEMSDLWGAPIAWLAAQPILVASRRDLGIARTPKQDRLYRWVSRRVDQVQAVSEEVRRTFIARDGIPPERVVTVHNGVDMDKILEAGIWPNFIESFGLDAEGHTVVTGSGKVYPIKGIDNLIRAAALVCREFPHTNFVIGGWLEGTYPDELRALAAELGVSRNIKLIGRAASPMWPLLKSVDIYCQLSRSEGHSNGLLEAMACGLPCVATAVGGNPETIGNGTTGFLVETEDYQAAAAHILQLLRDPDLRKRMGEAGQATVRARFTSEQMASNIVMHYGELLAARDHKRQRSLRRRLFGFAHLTTK